MNSAEAYHLFLKDLYAVYDKREAQQIANIVFEKITGHTATVRILHKTDKFSTEQKQALDKIKADLLSHIPLQYILSEAWFLELPFYVNPSVLIPRPETEELVEWIMQHLKGNERILDIGTGSGCIAIALKKNNPELEVWAMDKYADALNVAEKNATRLNADIHFIKADLLAKDWNNKLPSMDILVSNPPYIPSREREEMDHRVTSQEPATALFVPDDHALIYYEAILKKTKQLLPSGGKVFVEIHEEQGPAVKELFEKKLNNVVLKKDFSGKNRMVYGEHSTTTTAHR